MLPKIQYALFDVEIPSTKQKIKIRSMTSREEKILLMAKEGDDETEIFNAIKQVVNNCIVTKDFDVDSLPIFDLEFAFIRIRSISVSNITKITFTDPEDGIDYGPYDVDLDKVIILYPEKTNFIIAVNEHISIGLKYPTASLYSNKEFLKSTGSDALQKLILSSIDKVYESSVKGDTIHDVSTLKPQEVADFMDSLPVIVYDEIRKFIFDMPRIHYEIPYTNSNGTEKKFKLSTLNDFFML